MQSYFISLYSRINVWNKRWIVGGGGGGGGGSKCGDGGHPGGYGAGVALESDTIPSFIKKAKDKKKILLGIKFPFYGCFIKGHVTTKAKKCQYHSTKNEEELNEQINTYLQNFIQRVTMGVINTHLVSPLPEIAFIRSKMIFPEGLQIQYLIYMNVFFGGK